MSDDFLFPLLIGLTLAALTAARRAKSLAARTAARGLLNTLLIVALVLLAKAVLVAAVGQ